MWPHAYRSQCAGGEHWLEAARGGVSATGAIVRTVAEPRVIVIVAGTANRLVSDVTEALRDTAPERIITIQYRVSRILGISLQHHALIVLRAE